MYEHADVTSRL